MTDADDASDVRHPPTQAAVQALRARLPGAVGSETVRELAGSTDGELGASIDEHGPELNRFVSADLPVRDRWARSVADERASRMLRAYVSSLEEAQRRDGLPHRPVTLLEEAEILPLVAMAVPESVLQETLRRVGRYGPAVTTIGPGDFEWTRIRDAARWASQRLDTLVRDLGARPGPAGQRIRELFAPWLLEAGRADEAARMFTDLESAPEHDAPRWLYLEARALAESGRETDAQRVMARAGAPGPYEPASERLARLQVRAGLLEHATRGAADASGIHDRVWALLLLGRTGEALQVAANAPAALLASDAVREARAVALAVDGAGGDELWRATADPIAAGHDGYLAARVHGGFQRLGPWEFPRRTSASAWNGPDAALIAELRRLIATVPTVHDTPATPLGWHLDLATLPASPQGLVQSPAGRRLLQQLDAGRDSNDKALQMAAALMETVLYAMSGEPERGAAVMRSLHPEPDRAQDATDTADLADTLAALIHPSEDAEARIRTMVSHRVQGERVSSRRAVATAVLFASLAMVRYENFGVTVRESVRGNVAHEVEVANDALGQRIELNPTSVALVPPLYLAAFFLARNELQALAAISHAPAVWASRYAPLLLGIRSAWGGESGSAGSRLASCVSDRAPPAIAARCASWVAHELGSADARPRERFAAEATRLAGLARAVDGPFVTTHAGGLSDFVPVALAVPGTAIDLETWRLRVHWGAGIGWVFAPQP